MKISEKFESIHGRQCFFTNSSYNCPALQLFGFSSARALSRAIARRSLILKAQSQACADRITFLNKTIHA